MSGLPLFTIGRAGLGLYSAYSKTGVIGLGDWAVALLRVVPRMWVMADRRNRDALSAMETEAKGKVPQDTGRLLNGISSHVDDDVAVFEAHAVLDDGDEDYAGFVEFGTHGSGVADASYFAGDGASALPGHRGHHGATSAEPYFFPAVADQLAKRKIDMNDIPGAAAAAEGFN